MCKENLSQALVEGRSVWYTWSITCVLRSILNGGGVVCHGWPVPTKDEDAFSDPAGASRGGPNELVVLSTMVLPVLSAGTSMGNEE
jgi:hypothetical protein